MRLFTGHKLNFDDISAMPLNIARQALTHSDDHALPIWLVESLKLAAKTLSTSVVLHEVLRSLILHPA
jgi:hypothetical protein